jgi:PKD repeat protein
MKTKFLYALTFLVIAVTLTASSAVLKAKFTYSFLFADGTNGYGISVVNQTVGDYDSMTLDMGDGTVYTDFPYDPHVYPSNPADYSIVLSVSNSQTGVSDSFSLPVSVPKQPCSNTFYAEATGMPGKLSFHGFTTNFPSIIYNTVEFNWDFGDGGVGSGANPEHTFPEVNQDYQVSLTTVAYDDSDSIGCSFTTTLTVNSGITAACYADYVFEIVSDDAMTYQFTNTSFYANGSEADSLEWTFDNGSTINEVFTVDNPLYTFFDTGLWTVTLKIYSGTCYDMVQEQINVDGTPPLRAFLGYVWNNYLPADPYTIAISDLSTGNATQYLWDFGDGEQSTQTGGSILKTYTQDGSYELSLMVTDELTGEQQQYKVPVEVPCQNCQAYFYYQATGVPGEIRLRAFKTQFVSTYWDEFYTWDFGDGNTGEGMNVTHQFDPGNENSYPVTVTFQGTDINGNISCTVSYTDTVYIELQSNASLSIDESDPLTVHFKDITQGDPQGWFWDFGDGNFSMSKNPTHNYTGAGTYTTSLTAYSGNMPTITYFETIFFETVSVDEIDQSSESLSEAYPNPSNGLFSIELDSKEAAVAEIVVFNLTGQVVYNNRLNYTGKQIVEINLSDQPAGYYQMVLDVNNQRFNKKLIVQ